MTCREINHSGVLVSNFMLVKVLVILCGHLYYVFVSCIDFCIIYIVVFFMCLFSFTYFSTSTENKGEINKFYHNK